MNGGGTEFFSGFEYTGSVSGTKAQAASNLFGKLTGGLSKILSAGVSGGKVAWGALQAGTAFVKRNAGKFVSLLGDFGTWAEAGLALTVGGSACVAGLYDGAFRSTVRLVWLRDICCWKRCDDGLVGLGRLQDSVQHKVGNL